MENHIKVHGTGDLTLTRSASVVDKPVSSNIIIITSSIKRELRPIPRPQPAIKRKTDVCTSHKFSCTGTGSARRTSRLQQFRYSYTFTQCRAHVGPDLLMSSSGHGTDTPVKTEREMN
ncbi:hypothetical protein RRG08_050950 [Elysia crispata]|uniref:Uncharacterized protein n=1 Tax=Elysia crispata TaxID=231223 RepID=A0AAE1D2T3_9GAST|nr:hypothetical protein RRG08_050950 [Elysia crispata]